MLPVGKLPQELLAKIIAKAPSSGGRVLLGPGIGLDCAVLDFGTTCLVLKTEPITFASQQLGWYAVQIAANDIVTTGALPKWMLLTVLLPENLTTPQLVDDLSSQVFDACRSLGIALIGGHTEITHGLDRPILVTTLIGEVDKDKLITPKGAKPGDAVILTKGVPIEGTALLAREFSEQLTHELSPPELAEVKGYLFSPGISVFKDALTAVQAGLVTAMHDPTEGGVVTALWELATACQHSIQVDLEKIPVSALSAKICGFFGLDPLGTIASGALLVTARPESTQSILEALSAKGIPAVVIGRVTDGPPEVLARQGNISFRLEPFARDEIARVVER